MQAASRESLGVVNDRFEELVAGCDGPTLDTLGTELSEVTALLAKELTLRKLFSEPTASPESKQSLADRLFARKISDTTLEVLRSAVAQRWSTVGDLVTAVERFARQAVLTSAERANAVEDVEDELFRFGRVLESTGRLTTLLSDDTAPVEGRVQLLDQVVGGKVREQTKALLEQAVRAPRGKHLDTIVGELAELAAARRQQTVAHVRCASALSDHQRDRLVQVLSSIYHTTVSLQVEIDPEVLGGLVVRVGDEVIDGSIAAKLARANQELPN